MEITRDYFSIRLYFVLQILANLFLAYQSDTPIGYLFSMTFLFFNLFLGLIFYLDFLGKGANRVVFNEINIEVDRRLNIFKSDSLIPLKAVKSVQLKSIIGRSLLIIYLKNGEKKRIAIIADQQDKIQLRGYLSTLGVHTLVN